MLVRAKMILSMKTEHPPSSPDSCMVQLKFSAVTSGPDNQSWSKWTPQGELTMTVTNPEAVKFFEIGKSYYLDFSPA